MNAPTGMEQLVRMLCKWMGLDMEKLGPQVVETMTKIQEAEAKIDEIRKLCESNKATLARIEGHFTYVEQHKLNSTYGSFLGGPS